MWSGLGLLAATELKTTLRRQLRVACLLAVASILCLCAIGFGLVALHAWLVLRMTSIEASLSIASGLVALATMLLIAAWWTRRSRGQMSPLASGAIVAAPAVARIAIRRMNLESLGVVGALAAGAIIGRHLSQMRNGDGGSR